MPENENKAYVPAFMAQPAKNTPVAPPAPPAPASNAKAPATAQQVIDSVKDGAYFGTQIIKDYEQFRPDAYWDAQGKKWTIGWGFTTHEDGRPVKAGDRMEQPAADAYLTRLVSRNENIMKSKYAGWSDLKPNERGALLDLAHNLGPNWETYPKINALLSARVPDRAKIAEEIPTFRRAGGRVVQGLVNRRKDTLAMWQGGPSYTNYIPRNQRQK